MKFSYKYRLFPTKTHIRKLESTLQYSRELYNCALEHRICAWRKARVSITYKDQANSLPEIKESRAEYKEIYSQVLQDVLRRLDKNFKAFFKRGRGFPRFKGRNWYKSITYPLATLSDGTTIENPKHLAQSESKLANAQRIFSKQKKGT